MPTIFSLLRRRLLANVPDRLPDLPDLRRTERSCLFQILCSNRMVIGAFRYGPLNATDKPSYERVACMLNRLHAYQRDHNGEHLADVANLCQLEFIESAPAVHAQDDGKHTPML